MKAAAKKSSSILLLIFLAAASTLPLIPTATATAKPSTPQFTARYVDYSYDVPPVYGIDEFTGQTVVKSEGSHINNQSLVFRIKNQLFTPYNDSNGNIISLYYNFRAKGHFGTQWQYFPYVEGGGGSGRYAVLFEIFYDPEIPASNGEYTEASASLYRFFGENKPVVGDQVDVQVQALIGYVNYEGGGYYGFIGQSSDWSSTQTLTISSIPTTISPSPSPINSATASPNQPTTTPTQPNADTGDLAGFDWEKVAIVVLSV